MQRRKCKFKRRNLQMSAVPRPRGPVQEEPAPRDTRAFLSPAGAAPPGTQGQCPLNGSCDPSPPARRKVTTPQPWTAARDQEWPSVTKDSPLVPRRRTLAKAGLSTSSFLSPHAPLPGASSSRAGTTPPISRDGPPVWHVLDAQHTPVSPDFRKPRPDRRMGSSRAGRDQYDADGQPPA
uniref:Uncharacterized protein n=1 Tax=Molossus molossus TaxID=27622 RepID=A0A7J8HGW4_MOLMO|nr:hypothetical protein HJG59_010928 [Molossus molossus]